ncbi:GNAT family N-acetyltransferase [Candidatus Microgenomates bacterium]|nr:GNAT family N-acetyltransferase [Candidatus Microgenomates bacterium]
MRAVIPETIIDQTTVDMEEKRLDRPARIKFRDRDWLSEDCPDHDWGEIGTDYFSFVGSLDEQPVVKAGWRRADKPERPFGSWAGEVTVSVHPDYRRRGIGTETLQVMMDHMREQGITYVQAHNFLMDGPVGGELLESCGFEQKKQEMMGTLYVCDLTGRGRIL